MLTPRQIDEFDQKGFFRISAAFSQAAAGAMEDKVWKALDHQFGVCRNAPETWAGIQPTGLQHLKEDPAFEAIGSPATIEAIDDLLGAGRWRRPLHWGQFLVTFPSGTSNWDVPCGNWHTDFGFLTPPDRISGLLVFSFLAPVGPRSGGTAVLEGSHRLVRRFVRQQPAAMLEKMKRVRKALLVSDPWLQELNSQGGGGNRIQRFMESEHRISGIPLRVAELSGEAGDIVVGHPWLLHTVAPNCGRRPRMMRVQRVHVAS